MVAYFLIFRHIRPEDETWYISKNRLIFGWWAIIIILFVLGFVVEDTLAMMAKSFGKNPIPEAD
jgi:hypothetical protein